MSPDEPHSQLAQSVGAKMRAARLANKLTQSQLAKPEFSVSYISAIERGQIRPSLRALTILTARLGLSSTQLLAGQTPGDVLPTPPLSKPSHREEKTELMLLEAYISLQQGAARQALEQLQLITTKNVKLQQQLQYLLGWAYLHTAQFEESKDALSEAARLANDPSINVRILNMLGTVHTATRNDSEALGAYQHCLDLLAGDQQCNPFLTIQVYTNLGECYLRLNQVDQAVATFQHAAALTEELATPEQLIALYGRLHQDHTNADEHHLATLYAHKCLHLYSQASRRLARSELYHQLCHAMMQRDQEQARTFLDAALQQEKAGQDQLSVASITTHLAAWFFAHNALAEAKEHAQKAYEEAQPFGDTIIAAEASMLLGDIAYVQSQHEEGDTYFGLGLAMLERLGTRDELADGLAHYAQLLEDGDKPEQALKQLKRAFEIRQM